MRRHSKVCWLISLSLFIYHTGVSQQITGDNPPNIIFLLTDDQRWDALGYQGNEIIQTPNMDQLAKEGIYFKNAFVTTPICAASRASIITGKYERSHQYTFGQPPLRRQLIDESYFSLLKESGYYNGFLGKLGVRFEDRMDTSLFDVYKPQGANFYWRMDSTGSKHVHLTDLMGQQAVDFIRKAPENQPFSLSVSYNAPHAEDRSPDQYIWPKDLDALYQNIEIPGPLMGANRYFEEQPEYVRSGLNRERWYWRYDSPEKYQQMVKGYYRMISGIDRTIGTIRAELERKGVAQNTVIILLGDNGYFLGERQFAGKWLMYEPSLRVPMIIYKPGNSHREIDDLVLNIDVTPTILEFAGITIPEGYQGIGLSGYAEKRNNPAKKRESFICEHLWKFDRIPASEGIRTKQFKYFRYVNDPDREELYNLKKDPGEKVNLALETKSQSRLEKLRALFLSNAEAIK